MSKLDSFIRRMSAQRDCLNFAKERIMHLPGVVFELGLGNGRTYDHLREILPTRDIYVFDRRVDCFPSCMPPSDHLFMGEIVRTLAMAAQRFGNGVALLHNDLGTSDKKSLIYLLDSIYPLIESVMLPGAVVISSAPFHSSNWTQLPEPPGVKPGRYYLYQAGQPVASGSP